jgi:TrpR-related protein YerC/YecD
MSDNEEYIKELCDILLQIKNQDEMYRFLKDLTTPQELESFSERWRICKLLAKGDMSYREISAATGVSLATISRVARFLKNEPYQGYQALLDKIEGGN